ncbi:DJ-1/PfpI family protein [Psychromicrobium lacuslunae]|uniref:DJ-1/PfpI family protein n=1 Tax=Psychromicrobium lacuslunae TaxID=1618207 RepID=UPI0005D3D3B9|nr:DJ-1/PfpI family protein [Psychromicrobium lacuslunae]
MSTPVSPAQRVGIVVFDQVEVLDCCGPFEVFSVANRVSHGRGKSEPFKVSMIAKELEVSARGGLVLRSHSTFAEGTEFDVLLVAGGVTDDAERDDETINWLQHAANRTPLLASVCTGAFLLATAGILTTQRVTTHWEDQAELQRRWPSLQVEANHRWVRDGNIFTSGGISAGIDLALHLVEVCGGADLALATARQMEYDWRRASGVATAGEVRSACI